MYVKIQLIRDNGNVVQQIEGNASQPLSWRISPAIGHLVTEDGWKLAGFSYAPCTDRGAREVDQADMALHACLEEQCQAAAGTQEELRTPNTVEYIVRLIGALGTSDRRTLFEDRLPAAFCRYCGSELSRESPKCYCEADE